MLARALDHLIGICSPQRALQRLAARATMSQIELLTGGTGGYKAGKLDRLNRHQPRGNLHENAIPFDQIDRLQAVSADLWRNNPHARKIVRQIETKTIGRGMRLQSLATRPDETPHVEFRARAQLVWRQLACQFDYRGRPGHGGQHFTDLSKRGIRKAVLNGNTLFRLKTLSRREQNRRGLLLPLVLQLIDARRLDQSLQEHNGNQVFRGVEIDSDGRPLGYHVLAKHPTDPRAVDANAESTRVPADEIGHLFISDDDDQVLGVPWFAAAIDPVRDAGDLQYNELKASAMGACVVLGYRRPSGVDKFGLTPPQSFDLTDADGNKITSMQPGMIMDLGHDGEMTGFNPQRPNTNVEGFLQHILRTTAGAFPGIKGSSLTGDYRKSSFASERSADNDIWPEMEGVQQWFSCSFQQPIYERVIEIAILAGRFDDVISVREYVARRDEFLAAEWQGPVCRSINPTDDAEAAALRVRNGTSSPQLEAASVGRNWLEILRDISEYVQQIDNMKFPPAIAEQLILQVIGVGSAVDDSTATIPKETENSDDNNDDDSDDETDDENDRTANRISHLLKKPRFEVTPV